jgi:hypothetical protein
MKSRKQTYWCIFDPDKKPMLYTISSTRKASILAVEYPISFISCDWKELYSEGYRCKKVRISEVKIYD